MTVKLKLPDSIGGDTIDIQCPVIPTRGDFILYKGAYHTVIAIVFDRHSSSDYEPIVYLGPQMGTLPL
jgi:hypothetical protein